MREPEGPFGESHGHVNLQEFNAGDARITGAEINLRQNLRLLGKWGSYFTLFVNGTNDVHYVLDVLIGRGCDPFTAFDIVS